MINISRSAFYPLGLDLTNPGDIGHDFVLGEHRQNRQSETSNSLVRAIKLGYILPALLHSQDGRVKRRERLASVERGDVTTLLPCLMGYTYRASARRSNPAHEATDETKFKRAPSACHHPWRVTVSARNLLAEPRVTGSEATWERMKAKFPDED